MQSSGVKKIKIGKPKAETEVYDDGTICRLHSGVPHKVHKVFFFHDGDIIHGLEFIYRFGTGMNMLASAAPHCGKEGKGKDPKKSVMELEIDEFIVQIVAKVTDSLDYIQIDTNKGNSKYYGSTSGGGTTVYKADPGHQFSLFSVGVGNRIDYLEVTQVPILK